MELNKWQPPKPLKGYGMKLTKDSLPPVLREVCENISLAVQIPIEAVAVTLLSVISASTVGNVNVKWKNHLELCCIWSLSVLPSGSRKSEMVRLLQKPLFEIDKTIKETGKKDRALARSIRQTIELQLQRAQKRTANDYSAENMAEVEALTAKLESTPEMHEPSFIAHDFTPEALSELLSKNKSIVSINAEGGILGTVGGRYSNGVANLDPLLKGFTGESTIIQRKGSVPVEVKSPHFVMALCVQKNVLDELMNSKEMMNRGFFSRFLFCFPESPIGKRTYSSPALNEKLLEIVNKTIYEIYLSVAERPLEMHLTVEAEKLLSNVHDLNEKKAGEYDSKRNEAMAGWHSKLLGSLVRIAACYQLFADSKSKEISAESMNYAIELIPFLSSQAENTYGIDTTKSKNVLETLVKEFRKRSSVDSVDVKLSVNEIHRLLQGQVWIKDKGVKPLLKELKNLEMKGWIKLEQYERPDGKLGQNPSPVFIVHPEIIEYYETEII